ncbi:MAG: AraC family ligand binding domain-containing protein [Alphaproteobacteria bacterium]
MSGVKLFRAKDLNLKPGDHGITTVPVVNAGYSTTFGAGFGTLQNCSLDWTVTYDEVLYIMAGTCSVKVRDQRYSMGPGDMVWLPKDTPLTYEAGPELCTFFYAVSPVTGSPSTSKRDAHPEAQPEKA